MLLYMTSGELLGWGAVQLFGRSQNFEFGTGRQESGNRWNGESRECEKRELNKLLKYQMIKVVA